MNKEIKRLKKELLDEKFVSMGYKVFDNPPFSRLLECLESAPLMFGSTLSVIHADKYLSSSGISLEDKQTASIDFALSSLSSSVNIIFVCKIPRDENKKPDSRKKFYKIISKYAQVREFAQFKSYDKALHTAISNIAADKDLKINPAAVSVVIEQTGSNLTLIDSEFEKLKTALYPETEITAEAVKKYCTSREDIFALADLIIKGDKNEILKQYSLLAEKRHVLEIFAFLQSSMQKYIFIKNYEKRMSSKDIALKLKMHEYVLMKTQEKLRKITLERLIKIREHLINAEYKLKSGQAGSGAENTLLELALLS